MKKEDDVLLFDWNKRYGLMTGISIATDCRRLIDIPRSLSIFFEAVIVLGCFLW